MTKEEARDLTLNPGEVIIISNGEYSDYTVLGVYKVLKELNRELLISIATKVEDKHKYVGFDNKIHKYLDFEEMVGELVKAEYIEKILTKELYIGAYGKTDLEIR